MQVMSRQRGFPLIEVLVAVLIFSIGLIGLAGLMVMATRSNHAAYLRTQVILLRATAAKSGVSIQSLGTTVVTFGQQGQLDPGTTKLKFVTCYRSGSSGVGTTSTAVPSAELDVNGSGSVSTYTGTACTPTQ